MQKVVTTGIALSALLAWSIAVAQNTNTQPTQVAATEGTTTTTTETPPADVPAGTEGQIVPGVSNTALAVGAGALLVGGAIIASQNDDDNKPATTTTR